MSKKDVIIKEYMRDKTRFADVFNYYLFNGNKKINASDLNVFDMFPQLDLETMSLMNNYRILLLTPADIDDFEKFHTELGVLFKFLSLASDKSSIKTIKSDMDFEEVDLETVRVMEICAGLNIKRVLTKKGGINMCQAWIEFRDEERAEGRAEGENKFASLVSHLLKENLIELLEKVTEDIALRESCYEKYGIK